MGNDKTFKILFKKEDWLYIKKRIHKDIEETGRITGAVLRYIAFEFQIFSPHVYWTSEDSFREIESRTIDYDYDGIVVEIDEPRGVSISKPELDFSKATESLKEAAVETGRNIVKEAVDVSTEFDPVSKPSHYTEGRKYEPRKVIYDWGLNFNLGNAVKYISRAGRKNDSIEDLKKAIQYMEFELEELENGKE